MPKSLQPADKDGERYCPDCDAYCSLSKFYPGSRPNTYQRYCIDHHNARKKVRYAANAERYNETSTRWAKANPDKVKKHRQKNDATPERQEYKRRLEQQPHMRATRERYRLEHRDERLEKKRAYDAEHREEKNRKSREHYAANKERILDQQKVTREQDGERIRANERRSKVKRSEENRVAVRRRRDSLRARGGSISAQEQRALFARYGWRCLRCGAQKPIAFDHVDPKGPGSVENGQPLCTSCNSWKLARYDQNHQPFDFRHDSPYDLRSDLGVGSVDLSMGDLPVPEWVRHPRREFEQTEKICLGPTHPSDGLMLPIEDFPIRSQKSGKTYRKSFCKPCLAELLRMARR